VRTVLALLVRLLLRLFPASFRERHGEIPWGRIVGLRNRVVHAYFDVDLELVWEIVRAELPDLKAQLESLPAETKDEGQARGT